MLQITGTMKILSAILLLSLLVSCTKETPAPADPWNLIHLKAEVSYDQPITSPGGAKYWKSTVVLDKQIYDSIFVIVQWDAYSSPGSTYLRTIKDTIKIGPQPAGQVTRISNIAYQPAWSAQDVKIVFAWSSVWNRYVFQY